MTSTNGTPIVSMASINTDPSSAGARWLAIAPYTSEWSGATRSNAAATPAHNTAGSLSASSVDSQPTGCCVCFRPLGRGVDLPIARRRDHCRHGCGRALMRSNKAVRRTAPKRAAIGCNFDVRILKCWHSTSTLVASPSDKTSEATASAVRSVNGDITHQSDSSRTCRTRSVAQLSVATHVTNLFQ